MELTIWDILEAIKKWFALIIILTIVSTSMAFLYVKRAQSYTAQVVIKYNDPNTAKGMNPKGDKFDVYEIVSPAIIESSIKDLGVITSVENVRRSITINPVIPENIKQLEKSKIESGEEFIYHPVKFYINYTVNSSNDGEYARNMLETILKNYYKFYSEKYLNQFMPPEVYKSINAGAYDYIETAEIINNKVTELISFLITQNGADNTFRSSKTGLNFADLEKEYNVLKNVDIKLLFSYIYFGRLTLNKEELIKKYQFKTTQSSQKSTKKIQEANTALSIIDEYSKNNASKPSPNNNGERSSSISNEVIRDEKFKSSQTTYDKVMNQYVNARVESSNALIEIEDYKSVIDNYQKDAISPQDKEEFTIKAKESIKHIESKLKTLYELTDLTLTDYHNYNVSKYISYLSSVNIINNVSLRLYLIISFALGVGAGIFCAITIEVIRKFRKVKYSSDVVDA